MASITWKSSEILKVFGTTIREGIYTGGKANPIGGVITRDSPTNFTPAKIAKIYENISTHVPIYVGHSTSPTRRPVGYAYKFGVTETLDDIKYNGFIFDPDAIRQIALGGYDKVSPEISEDDERLLSVCFVPNPAISGTEADMEAIVFSKGDPNTPGGDTQMTDNTPTPTAQPAAPQTPVAPAVPQYVPTTATPAPAQPVVQPTVSTDVSALVSQVEDFRGKYEQANARIEALMTQQYDTVVSEMKGLGVSDPGSIVRGLATEQKIAVLSKMKENIVLNKPLASPSNTSPTEDKTMVDSAVNDVLKELGVSPEMYAKISKR